MNRIAAVLAAVAMACASAVAVEPGTPVPGAMGGDAAGIKAMFDEAGDFVIKKNWEEAAAVYRRILKADAGNPKASFGLGTCMIQLKRFQEAVKILEPMLSQAKDEPALKNNLAWIYATAADPSVRNIPRAVRLAQEAVLAAPNDPDVWSTLAEAHYAAADYTMAVRAARIAVQQAQEFAPGRVWGFWDILRRCNDAAEQGKRSKQRDVDLPYDR